MAKSWSQMEPDVDSAAKSALTRPSDDAGYSFCNENIVNNGSVARACSHTLGAKMDTQSLPKETFCAPKAQSKSILDASVVNRWPSERASVFLKFSAASQGAKSWGGQHERTRLGHR